MAKRLEYDGTPHLNRKREIKEFPFELGNESEANLTKPIITPRQEAVDSIFNSLAKTYIKGQALLKGLSEMYPAQEIPIEDGADTVKAAARRLDVDQSKKGTVISYSMFQKAVDTILGNNWTLRREYLKINLPATKTASHRKFEKSKSGDKTNLIKDFLDESAIAGIIIAMFTISPFQTIIFQGLTTEQSAAKGLQVAQIPIGIALLIEFGIKGAQIYELLKTSGLNNALTEAQIVEIEESQEKRAEILSDIGINYSDYIDSMSDNDSKIVIDYFNEYFARYGGLVDTNSYLTLDHWVAYLHTAETQQKLRGALNTGAKYSNTFDSILPDVEDSDSTSMVDIKDTSKISVHVDIVGSLKHLNTYSNTVFDDIVHSFMYQITDRDMCCLVEILGEIGDPKLLRTISAILRILATDLGGNITHLLNTLTRALLKKLQTAVFEIMQDINEYYEKIILKLLDAFTIDIEGLPACGGLLSIGMALIQSLNVLNEQLKWLVNDIMDALTQYSTIQGGSWAIAADRRHLLGMSNLLEVLANRLEIANLCARENGTEQNSYTDISEIKDEAARQILYNVLDTVPASIQLSDEQINKYFPGQEKRESARLNFSYGINTTQSKVEQEFTDKKCSDSVSKEQIMSLAKSLKVNLNTAFGNANS